MGDHRTHVVLPEELVAQIDALVGQRKRSAFLAEVAQREVRRRGLLKLLEKPGPFWKPEDHPEIDEAGGAYEWVKNMRRESERGFLKRTRAKKRK
jgi:Arc/MetJ-type ribon-helix-helix transcriptional regulator